MEKVRRLSMSNEDKAQKDLEEKMRSTRQAINGTTKEYEAAEMGDEATKGSPTVIAVTTKRPSMEEMGLDAERERARASLIRRRGDRAKFMAAIQELMIARRRTKGLQEKKLVIRPDSSFRLSWDMWCMIWLMYTALFTPYQIAFCGTIFTMHNISDWPFLFFIDRLIDCTFFADIIINFRTAWELDDGMLFFEGKEAARRYLRFWFWPDLISTLPYEFLSFFVDSGAGGSERLPKLLRLMRLAKLVKVLRASRIVKRMEQNLTVRYSIIRLFQFVIGVLLIAHWLACGLAIAATAQWLDLPTWIEVMDLELENVSTHRQYVKAFYWAIMTLTTIGYGDVGPQNYVEEVYMTMAMIFGAGVFAYALGTIVGLLQQLQAATLGFQQTMDGITEYMHARQASKHLMQRVRKYCFYCRDLAKTANEQTVLASFSPSLRSEMLMNIYAERVKAIKFFSTASSGCLNLICELLSQRVFGPNDMVISDHKNNKATFIIKEGRIQEEFHMPSDIEFGQVLMAGSFIGWRSLMTADAPGEATYRAMCFVELLHMEAAKMREVLDQYPREKAHARSWICRGLWRKVMYVGNFMTHLRECKQGKNPKIIDYVTALRDGEFIEGGDTSGGLLSGKDFKVKTTFVPAKSSVLAGQSSASTVSGPTISQENVVLKDFSMLQQQLAGQKKEIDKALKVMAAQSGLLRKLLKDQTSDQSVVAGPPAQMLPEVAHRKSLLEQPVSPDSNIAKYEKIVQRQQQQIQQQQEQINELTVLAHST